MLKLVRKVSTAIKTTWLRVMQAKSSFVKFSITRNLAAANIQSI